MAASAAQSKASSLDPVLVLILEQLKAGVSPKKVIELLDVPPPTRPMETAQSILAYYRTHHGLTRRKIATINTLEDAVGLLQSSSRIMVLVGAGISVSCGVPDFRSARTGLYDALQRSGHPALESISDPQEIFDIHTFKEEPDIFYSIARILYHGAGVARDDRNGHKDSTSSSSESTHNGERSANDSSTRREEEENSSSGAQTFKPSLTHRFLAALERSGRLLRVYTQNIDGLEGAAGVSPDKLVQCHGSLATVTCLRCRKSRPSTDGAFMSAVDRGAVARCDGPSCVGKPDALLKPDCVFFHEPLPRSFDAQIPQDLQQADLLLVMGSSLKVKPVSEIPGSLPRSVPALLINMEPLFPHSFDVDLLGPADVVSEHLWRSLNLPGLQVALEATGPQDAMKATVLEGDATVTASNANASATASALDAIDTDNERSSQGFSSASSNVTEEGGDERDSSSSSSSSAAAAVESRRDNDISDIQIQQDPVEKSRYRFSSARHDAVSALTKQAMVDRTNALLGANTSSPQGAGSSSASSSCSAAEAKTSRSGRALKKPRFR